MHRVVISNNITDFSLVGDSQYPNAIQEALVSVEIGSTCRALAPSCFAGCANLVSVCVPSECIDIGDSAFAGDSKLSGINCLAVNGHKLATIGNNCFDGCNALSSVYLSLGAPVSRDVKIGSYAFANCENLQSVTWRDWSYMGEKMFAGCKKLKTLNVSNNTNYVHPYAFAEIPNIEKIDIPNKIWFLNDGMFAECGSLTAVNIQDTDQSPSWLNMIGSNVFSGCSQLTSMTLPRSINALSCLDRAMLSGSYVQKLYCSGLPDSVFVTDYVEKYEISNTTYVTTSQEWKNIAQAAYDIGLPVIMFTNHGGLTDTYQNGCSYCQDLVTVLNSASWKSYMQSRISAAYFLYCAYDNDVSLWKNISYQENSNPFRGLYSFGSSGYYAKAGGVIRKTDGTIKSFDISPYSGGVNNLTARCEEIISMSDGGTVKNIKLNDGISKLGSSLDSVTFVSNQGHEFICSSDVQIEYQPEVRVDRETVSDFRYGTWYYNAMQLRTYADLTHIPVFVEYSSAGCDPCVYFKKNVYNNTDFQDWVKDSPYLFCRIEIESYESFSNPSLYPQPYYVDKVWAKEKYGENPGYIPIMMWYWNKGDGNLVFDLSSYHFNPSAKGSNPPFSMDELIRMTDDKFKGYVQDPAYGRYDVYDLYSNSGKVIGKYCSNIDGDTTGVAFPCSYKTNVDTYEKAFDLSGYSVIQQVSVGDIVQYAPNTYYVYDTTMAQSYHIDRYGVIFRVDSSDGTNKVAWIQATQNKYENDKPEQTYECARWYNLSSTQDDCELFDDIVKESERMDYRIVILKTSTNNEICRQFEEYVKYSDEFEAFVMSLSTVYFIEVKPDNGDFKSGIGKKLKDFYKKDFRQDQDVHFGSWDDDVPRLIVYQGCSSCSVDPTRPAVLKAVQLDPSGKTPLEVILQLTDALM